MNATTAMIPVGNHQVPAEVFDAIRGQLVAKLGDGEVFWITEAGQQKRGFKAKCMLDCPVHFCWPAGTRSKSMITGEGFDKLNQYAGIEIFRPKTLMGSGGKEVGNPFFERDTNGALTSCTMRGIGIGYGPTGNLVAVDQTVYVHLQTLLVQEIQAKIKRHPAIGMMGSPDQRPTEITFYGDNGERGARRVINAEPTVLKVSGFWHFIPFANGVGYWVNLSHPEMQAAFDSFAQKQRFLERSAFTVLKRLVLSSHPAIGCKTPNVVEQGPESYGRIESGKAFVVVYGFKPEAGGAEKRREDLAAMADRVAAGDRMANMTVVEPPTHDASDDESVGTWEDADPSELPPDAGHDEGPAEVGARQVAPPPPPTPPTPPAPAEPPAAAPPPPQATGRRPVEGVGYPKVCAACNGTGKASNGNPCAACHPATAKPAASPAGSPPTAKTGKAANTVAPVIQELNTLLASLATKPDQQASAVKIRDEMGHKMWSSLRAAGEDAVASFLLRFREVAQ